MTEYFIPTKEDILNLEIGSLAPDFAGKLKPIVEIFAKEQDIYGKWYCCYYIKFYNGKMSHSLKEGELDRSFDLIKNYKSHELDRIEAKLLKERGIELPERLNWVRD